LVRKGEARFGIGHVTDAFAQPGLRVALTFPADSHDAIVYAFALPRRVSWPQ
jgi:molybdate transport system substrate-binding protein